MVSQRPGRSKHTGWYQVKETKPWKKASHRHKPERLPRIAQTKAGFYTLCYFAFLV